MTTAATKISDYLSRGTASDHTIRCLLGMIETGEIRISDVEDHPASGVQVAARIDLLSRGITGRSLSDRGFVPGT